MVSKRKLSSFDRPMECARSDQHHVRIKINNVLQILNSTTLGSSNSVRLGHRYQT